MHKLAWLAIIPAFALLNAQPASLTLTGPIRAQAGAPVVLMLSLASGGGPAALQWDMGNLPSGAVVASSIANKQVTCSITRCVLWGMNTAAILDGQVATISYTQSNTPAPLTVSATLGASPAGAAIPITAPSPLTVPLQSNCDVNGDGVVDTTDVTLTLQQAVASTTGTPTVIDVIKEILVVMGGACLR